MCDLLMNFFSEVRGGGERERVCVCVCVCVCHAPPSSVFACGMVFILSHLSPCACIFIATKLTERLRGYHYVNNSP